MADTGSADQGGRSFGRRRGGGGRRRRGRRGPNRGEDTEWVPLTKLGRLVKANAIKYIEEIYLHSLVIKEADIIDHFLKESLKDEVMKISPVQKQTRAGQRTRFKAYVVVGDVDGHIGLGVKCSKEVANAIRGAIIIAKLAIVPIRRGYWGNKIGKPHTVATKVNGKCGSVGIRLVPAPRGTGLVASPTSKKILTLAGVDDCYTGTRGCTRTLGNFAKATYNALAKTYSFLTPDLWPAYEFQKPPFQEHTDYLAQTDTYENKKGKDGKDEDED